MRFSQILSLTVLLWLSSLSSLFAQDEIPPGDDVRVFLDEQDRFVFYSPIPGGFSTGGLDIQSGGGGLIPVPPGGVDADPSPFTVFLANRPTQVTMGLVGGLLNINGRLTTNARWDRGKGIKDLTVDYGDGSVPSRIPLGADFYDQCFADCGPDLPELITITLNSSNKLVVTGIGQEISRITFKSSTNQLGPGTDPAPFNSVIPNSIAQIAFDSIDNPVELSGSFVLDATFGSVDAPIAIDVLYPDGSILSHGLTKSLNWFSIVETPASKLSR